MSRELFLNKSAVAGAGLMGSQISLVLAMGSEKTMLLSRRRETLDAAKNNLKRYASDLQRHDLLGGETPEAVLARIHTTTDLEEAVGDADYVVESISEVLEAKQELFARMDAIAPRQSVLASNTSGLPISKLAERVEYKDRIAGAHFVQPGHIVPVVEVIRTPETSDAAMDRNCEVWERLGRMPLRCNKDIPGFMINRLQHAVIREAVALLASGVADARSIDLAIQLGLGPRFTTAGPLEQRDINGLTMHSQVATHLWQHLSGTDEALAYLQGMVARGETGLDSGKGYYDWSGKDAVAVRSDKDEQLLQRTRQVMEAWHASQKSQA